MGVRVASFIESLLRIISSPFCESNTLMTTSGDSLLAPVEAISFVVAERPEEPPFSAAPDLVFTQDATGTYLSFFWARASEFDLSAPIPSGQWMGSPEVIFAPLEIDSYLERVQQVFEYQNPDRFQIPFKCGDRLLIFDLTLSPILAPSGHPSSIVVTGRSLYVATPEQAQLLMEQVPICSPTSANSSDRQRNQYHKQLNQVAATIRRSLDLHTIWQQTATGLGETSNVSRCLVCIYTPGQNEVRVVAEHCQEGFASLQNHIFDLNEEPSMRQAIETQHVVQSTHTPTAPGTPFSSLVVATSHKDETNGLILLHQCDRPRLWKEVEIEAIQELADQVGTSISHATLLAASRNLASKLQRANEDIMQKNHDLEEARRQAEEASRLKSEFLANTSHELRTPLNGMIGFLKLVMDGMADDPQEQSEFIEEAHNSAVHLLNIINDILDIAKIEAGKMQLERGPVHLDDLLSEVEDFTKKLLKQKQLSFEIRTPATRDEVVLFGNYQRLLQVMLNLVGNAIKFTPEGGITITAEVISKRVVDQMGEKPGMVRISVADTGIGVSLEKQDKLFQSFSQVDGSRTRQYGGTGLGLAISQKLVEAMDGVVNFYSMGEGLGSTVTFTVPLYQDPVMIATQPSTEAPSQD